MSGELEGETTVAVELRLPNETLKHLNAVAVLANVSTEQVINVILALDAMRMRTEEQPK